MNRTFVALALALYGLTLPSPESGVAASRARYHVDGPVRATLVSVIDGDTVMVNAEPWPQQSISVMVRLRDIDAPELMSRCPRLRQRARDARNFLQAGLQNQPRLLLSDIDGDKYFGRVVARLTFGGQDASQFLLAAGFARPYDGGRKAQEQC